MEEFSYLRTVLDWLLERVKLSPEAYRSLPSNRSLMAVSEMVLQKSMAPSLSSSVSDLLQLPTLASLATRQHTIESDYRLLLEMHSRMQVAASHLSNARLALVTFPQLARTAFMTLFGSDSTTATSLRNSSAPYDKLCTTIYDNLLPFRSKQGRFSVNITLSPALISELVTLPSASLPKELRPLQKSSVIPSATFNISATITDDKFERTFVEIVTNVLEEVLLVPACRTLEKYSDRLEMGVRNKEEEDTLFDVDDTTLAERRDTKRRIRLRHNLISSLVGEDGADANLAIFALPLVFNFINRPGSFFHVSCRLSNDPRLVSRGMKKRSTVVQHVEERRIVNHLALIRINPLFLEASVKIKEGLSALRRALELQALGKGESLSQGRSRVESSFAKTLSLLQGLEFERQQDLQTKSLSTLGSFKRKPASNSPPPSSRNVFATSLDGHQRTTKCTRSLLRIPTSSWPFLSSLLRSNGSVVDCPRSPPSTPPPNAPCYTSSASPPGVEPYPQLVLLLPFKYRSNATSITLSSTPLLPPSFQPPGRRKFLIRTGSSSTGSSRIGGIKWAQGTCTERRRW